MAKKNLSELSKIKKWCKNVIDGKIIANKYRVKACERFLRDLENPQWEFKEKSAAFVVRFIEKTFKHIKGPARGKFFKLEMWEKFI